MYEFMCGHQECSSRLASRKKEVLLGQVEDHLMDAHNVQEATQALMSYLEATCVTSSLHR
jgi:hypothetical protein